MKKVSEKADGSPQNFQVGGLKVLWNVKTGKPKEFHPIDVPEVLAGYSHEWSETPPNKLQEKAEDAIIVKSEKPKKQEAKPEEPKEPVVEEIAPALIEEEPSENEVISARGRKKRKQLK